MNCIIQHGGNIIAIIGTALLIWSAFKMMAPDKDDDHSWRN